MKIPISHRLDVTFSEINCNLWLGSDSLLFKIAISFQPVFKFEDLLKIFLVKIVCDENDPSINPSINPPLSILENLMKYDMEWMDPTLQ